jgi:hypothetical protein
MSFFLMVYSHEIAEKKVLRRLSGLNMGFQKFYSSVKHEGVTIYWSQYSIPFEKTFNICDHTTEII